MKRIVNGVTYNTQTSTALAEKPWGDASPDNTTENFGVDHLYQTRGGAFFLDEQVNCRLWDQNEREWTEREDHSFRPISAEKAHEWLLEGEVEVFHNPFDDPPEATAEAEPGATIYLRVPAALKHRVDEAASAEKVSGNAWAMRCIERCLANSPKEQQPASGRETIARRVTKRAGSKSR
jgi:predicted HicB family RNase H-like nuclease